MTSALRLMLAATILAAAPAISAAATPVRGRITDPDGLPLPGVVVMLQSVTAAPTMTTETDQMGLYALDVPPGRYRLTAQLSGFGLVTRDLVVRDEGLVVDLSLPLATFDERVTVSAASAVAMIGDPIPNAPAIVTRELIDNSMLPNSQYDDVLPLMPNVLRGPDGFISIGGARASQSGLLVNGSSRNDPITGLPGVMLPIEAVDAIEVHDGGYPVSLGGATGGVTVVATRAGADRLQVSGNSFFPRLLFADGGIHGVEFWEPNAGVSGVLPGGRVHFEQAVSVRYDRNRVFTLAGDQISKFTAFLSWSQIDVEISPAHRASITVSVDPQHTDAANINAFTSVGSAPVLAQGGWSTALSDRWTIGNTSNLEVRALLVRTSLRVTPVGDGASEVGHDLTSGAYFDEQSLRGHRTEVAAAYTWTAVHRHLFRFGGSVGQATVSGTDDSAPIDLLRSDGTVSRRITFTGAAEIAAATAEIGAYAQDTWTPFSWLTLDAGIRFDRATAAAAATVAPRMAAVLTTPHGGSVSASVGYFADKLVVGALAFPSFPGRSIQTFDINGRPDGSPAGYLNVLQDRLNTPRALRWDIGFDRPFQAGWLARLKYQERHGRDELVVDPDPQGLLVLSSTGASTARSFETTVGYRTPTASREIYVSYVRASTRGNLNSADTIGGVFKEPFVQPDEVGPLPMDVPNRLLAWGLLHFPGRVTVAPFAEARSGFPYSAVDDTWAYAGPRNGERLPWFGALDIYVNKIVTLPGHLPDARLGLKIYNVASIHNARDVQRDITRPDFGTTYNPVPRDFSFVFELLWGHR